MQGVRTFEQATVTDAARSTAFADFYRSNYGPVLAFAVRRLDDRESAREVALDVFRVAWNGFDPNAMPTRAVLLGVARNLIGDAYRRRDRDRRLIDALRNERSGDVENGADLLVQAVLDELAPAAREVLTLKYWDGMTAAQIGALVGASPGSVWVRLHRARQAFALAWARQQESTAGRKEPA